MEGTFKLDDSNRDKIKAAISKHLASIMGNDDDEDVLPEYVLVMIANQKSKDQVKKDLEAFLGDQSVAFTTWLWDTLAKFSSTANTTPAPTQSAARSEKPAVKQEDRGRPAIYSEMDISSDQSGKDRSSTSSNSSNSSNNRGGTITSPPKSVFASVISVPPQPKRRELETPAPSRLILNAMSDAVQSVNHSPKLHPYQSHSHPHTHNTHSHTHSYRDNRGEESMAIDTAEIGKERTYRTAKRGQQGREGSSGGIFSRLGNGAGGGNSGHYDDRARGHGRYGSERGGGGGGGGGGRGEDRGGGGRGDEPVTFTVTLTGIPDEPPKMTGSKRRSMESAEKSEKRDDEAMTDAKGEGDVMVDVDAPLESAKRAKKQRCQFWPNCKQGEGCAYIHPTAPCTNFPNCTYGENCFYIHPSIPCKFGTSCTRADCAYNHPHGRGAGSMGAAGVGVGAGVGVKGGGVVPCKYGYSCPRSGCTFAHPPEACRFGDACTKPQCAFAHGKACMFGTSCVTPNCTFVHTKETKDTSSVPCKFGAACTNLSCRYKHDTPRVTSKLELNIGEDMMVDASDVNAISATLPPTPPRAEEQTVA